MPTEQTPQTAIKLQTTRTKETLKRPLEE